MRLLSGEKNQVSLFLLFVTADVFPNQLYRKWDFKYMNKWVLSLMIKAEVKVRKSLSSKGWGILLCRITLCFCLMNSTSVLSGTVRLHHREQRVPVRDEHLISVLENVMLLSCSGRCRYLPGELEDSVWDNMRFLSQRTPWCSLKTLPYCLWWCHAIVLETEMD